LTTHKPLDLVIIMLGTNDLKMRFSVSAFDIAKSAGVLVGMTQSSETGSDNGSPAVLLIAPASVGKLTDFAEMFESDESLEPGDVVCLEKDFNVARCSQRADPLVMGVVSPDPTIAGNNQLDDAYPIGIVGIVPTKVKGPLEKGNLLTTSSLAGYAEKATFEDFGAIIGKAMDSCEEERCKINVLVGLR